MRVSERLRPKCQTFSDSSLIGRPLRHRLWIHAGSDRERVNFPSEIPTEQVQCSVGFFFSASDLDTRPTFSLISFGRNIDFSFLDNLSEDLDQALNDRPDRPDTWIHRSRLQWVQFLDTH